MNARAVRLMAFDVDGIFTDGSLYYGADGELLKVFNVQDGLGLKLLRQAEIQTAIITGRKSPMVEKRFSELGLDFVIQGRNDKGQALKELGELLALKKNELGYMGDDFPDLTTLNVAGFFATVPNAPEQVRNAASFISSVNGGNGAVRELCEFLLKTQGFDPLALFKGKSF